MQINRGNADAIADQIIEAVKPQIGAFDTESEDRWRGIRGAIRSFVVNGDYADEPTVEQLIDEVREMYGAELAEIGNA